MARLLSEDPDTISFFEIRPEGAAVSYGDQAWQPVVLHLVSGSQSFGIEDDKTIKESLLCRQPEDELQALLRSLGKLQRREAQRAYFEPSEPFFELALERSPQHGLKVEVWLDAGNATTGIYSWDAAGIRFHTTDQNLAEFISAIEAEFAC